MNFKNVKIINSKKEAKKNKKLFLSNNYTNNINDCTNDCDCACESNK